MDKKEELRAKLKKALEELRKATEEMKKRPPIKPIKVDIFKQ